MRIGGRISLADRYTIMEKLGEGGMAEVYRAQHLLLEREVAIKFIHHSLTDPEFDERFQREAQAVARLEHPNIVHLYDFDKDPVRGYFMVMELLQGKDLGHRLRILQRRGNFMPLDEALLITRSVAEALAYAHEQQVIHRDIKPSNIFLTENKRVVVTDFGIARLSDKAMITTDNLLVGTPHYVAPEIPQGITPDHRVDIYALGAMFFQMLTNQCPYEHENVLELIALHINAPIPDPLKLREDLPPAIRSIIQSALAKNPAHRYPNFDIMAAELDDLALNNDILLELPKGRTPTASRTIIRPSTLQIVRPPTPISTPTPTAEGETPNPNTSPTLPSVKHATLSWQTIVKNGLAATFIIIFGYWVITTKVIQDPEPPEPTAVTPLTIAVAQPGEYLYVVANVTNDRHPEVNVPHQLLNALQGGSLQSLLGSRFRAEYANRTIETQSEAKALAEETGALIVIWGVENATGLEIIIYAPSYSEKSINELRFLVTIEADYADIVANDLRLFLPHVTELMTNQQMLRDNIFLSTGDFGRLTQPPWENMAGLRVRPVTALETQTLKFMDTVSRQDYDAMDTEMSLILESRPEEFSFYFTRFVINMFIRKRLELARLDLVQLEALMPESPMPLWCNMMLYISVEDYPGLYTATFEANEPTSVAGQVMFYYHALAALMLGKFDEALTTAQSLDAATTNVLFSFPIQENMLTIIYEIQGDTEAVQPLYSVIRADRRVTRLATNFANARFSNPPITMVLWLAHALEINGETVTAKLAYRLILSRKADFYYPNWRLAGLAESAGDYEQARDFYQKSIDGATLSFPIAQYQLALLLHQHPELEPEATQVCTLLADATIAANTNPEFYTVLSVKINALQSEADCK